MNSIKNFASSNNKWIWLKSIPFFRCDSKLSVHQRRAIGSRDIFKVFQVSQCRKFVTCCVAVGAVFVSRRFRRHLSLIISKLFEIFITVMWRVKEQVLKVTINHLRALKVMNEHSIRRINRPSFNFCSKCFSDVHKTENTLMAITSNLKWWRQEPICYRYFGPINTWEVVEVLWRNALHIKQQKLSSIYDIFMKNRMRKLCIPRIPFRYTCIYG